MPEVIRSVMKQCVDEATPLSTSDTPDFIVDCRGTDKFLAKILHPISKVWVYLGMYRTHEEARDLCSRKKLEYASCFVQEAAASLHTNVTSFEKHPGIKRLQRGKWGSVIRHNTSQVSLGRYDTPNEAAHAYNLSKFELESQEICCSRKDAAVYSAQLGMPKAANKRPLEAVTEQSEGHQRLCSVYQGNIGEHNDAAQVSLNRYHSFSEAVGAYSLYFQENGCLRKDSADYSAESSMPKAVNKRTLVVDVEPSKKHQRPCCVYHEKIGEHKVDCLTNVICLESVDLEKDLQLQQVSSSSLKDGIGSTVTSTVYQDKSGKCKAEIQSRNVRHKLGSCATAEDARKAPNRKKCEFGLKAEEALYQKKCEVGLKAEEDLNRKKCEVGLKAEDAQEALSGKKCELGLKDDAKQSERIQRLRHAYVAQGGRWRTEIRHPIAKEKKIHLGAFDTPKEAADTYDNMKRQFELMFPGFMTRKQANKSVCFETLTEEAREAYKDKMREVDLMVRAHRKPKQQSRGGCKSDAIVEGKSDSTRASVDPFVSANRSSVIKAEREEDAGGSMIKSYAITEETEEFGLMLPGHKKRKQSCVDHPCVSSEANSGSFAEKPYNNKMHEFDLMVSDHEKREQLKASCEADAIGEGRSGPNWLPEDPYVSANGSSVIKAGVVSVPMLAIEKSEEFDLGIVDSYGRLIGEYSRLDDELWICSSEDFATLERDEGRIC